ncbi:FAD-dependent thymidylate synthase [Candidatus Micrarchaeota archaeon]|nr:FAD-dependent thymidylate synthase [Candidatus Micrarchaeota archaeon]
MDEFSEEEKRLLQPYVTNMDRPIFALTNLPEVVKGALFSRYSRSTKSLRRVLLDEFMLSDESGLKEVLMAAPQQKARSPVQVRKAEEFYERVLVGYGDDSVAELAGAHIAIEDISIVATKTLEDSRIGLSPLEKSTRYVYFDNKRDGRWLYHREKTLMASEFASLYEQTCDHAFQTYADLIPKISKFIMEREPRDDKTSERAYAATVRAKTCDILRGLLPASTLTNMGFFGDGRAFEYLLTKLYADDMAEMRDIGDAMHGELAKVIPSFVKRAKEKYGIALQDYFRKQRGAIADAGAKYSGASGGARPAGSGGEGGANDGGAVLVDYDPHAEDRIAEAALYPYMLKPMNEIKAIVKGMSKEEKETVIGACISDRENRRQKPGRAFEHAYYTFDVCGNYGCYRDMHRHRILTQQRQLLTPYLGYKMPKEITEAGYDKEFKDAMDRAKDAYGQIAKKYPKQAQYVIPLAYNIRWYMTFNLREAYHMLELRSSMQGHIDYREIAQKMFSEIEKVHPSLASGMRFMDMKSYAFERLEAEKRIDRKMEELAKKYGRQ